MKNPPILVAVIGFFAALAGFSFLFFGLRVLGFDWFGALGDLPALERVGLWGWLAVFTGIVWILAALGLWALQPWARLFAMIIAGLGLLEAVIAIFQFPGTGVGFGMALMPGLILLYLSSGEVKAAFGDEPAATAAAGMAAPAPAPAPVAAPPPAPAVAAPVALAAAMTAEPSAAEPVATPPPAAPPVPAAPASTPSAQSSPPAAAADSPKIEDIEGIGSANVAKLGAAGIVTTADLLAGGSTPGGRDRIAVATGISSTLILEWVNKADLMRVPGVGTQYSDLLEAAGVDLPAELAQRNPANLATTFQEVVAARPEIVRRTPSEAEVAGWIAEAKKLDKVVEH